ncbi:MAG: helix-turn-helix transcriptional regulator [Clostridia bacterium]|nr:helix-turn-helix transcriptional regulator [Clostridia bacterium]
MNEIYARIEALCKSHGMNITELCKKCSIPRASLTDFKMGRNKSLSATTLQKIAEYFSVSVEYLLSGEAPSPEKINLKVAFFGGEEGITDAMVEEVMHFAAYVKERERKR